MTIPALSKLIKLVMTTVTLPPLDPAHLDAPVARAWTSQTQTPLEPPSHETSTETHGTTLSYSFDRTKQSLRIVIKDESNGEVVRHIEFKSFHATLYRTDKLSGLLLDQQA